MVEDIVIDDVSEDDVFQDDSWLDDVWLGDIVYEDIVHEETLVQEINDSFINFDFDLISSYIYLNIFMTGIIIALLTVIIFILSWESKSKW